MSFARTGSLTSSPNPRASAVRFRRTSVLRKRLIWRGLPLVPLARIGPIWSQIDDDLVLRLTPSKTEERSQARVVFDLKAYPMVIEELASMPVTGRSGPLIVNPRTGLPYRHEYFRVLWHKCAAEAGISRSVWNRDLRAGGITEARQAGAPTDDVAKTAGHASKRTTAKVYDRDTLEAARRVAKARIAHRNGA